MRKAQRSANVGGLRPIYDRLVQAARHRKSRVRGRTLEEEADADHGRALFCPAFRRLQDKAQVFSLERNAAIRSRLTHSLEVSSIGRYIAQQALKAFPQSEQDRLGIRGKERAIITLVETACLLHDVGNPPFGHFGEHAISDWFHVHGSELEPTGLGPEAHAGWDKYFHDFRHFDGNPQGFRIVTKLQAKEVGDLCGMNLTATTLASLVKYPWTAESINGSHTPATSVRKKAGYYLTEQTTVDWIGTTLGLPSQSRHPFVYLMEAADDTAYCLSDIEDGIEKGLISAQEFARDIKARVFKKPAAGSRNADERDLKEMWGALCDLEGVAHDDNRAAVRRFTGMEHFRGGFVRYLARHAGTMFYKSHEDVLRGTAPPLLRRGPVERLLKAVKHFAETKLYSSSIVRERELTAHAVLSGLLNAYYPVMKCERNRFEQALQGRGEDAMGRLITGEQALVGRLPAKYVAVYREEVRRADAAFQIDESMKTTLERVHRIRAIVDYISGMTDEHALQMFRLVSGMDTLRRGAS